MELRSSARQGIAALAFFCFLIALAMAGCSGYAGSAYPTAPTGSIDPAHPGEPFTSRTDDYWPMQRANTWSFNYSFQLRDWESPTVIEGSYSGTLSWVIVDVVESADSVRATFRQEFVGVGTETRLRSAPNDYVTTTRSIADASTFTLVVRTDMIIRLSAGTYPVWQYPSLYMLFQNLDVYRFPVSIPSPDKMTYANLNSNVTLSRKIGPTSINYSIGGNSQRRDLSMNLIPNAQRR